MLALNVEIKNGYPLLVRVWDNHFLLLNNLISSTTRVISAITNTAKPIIKERASNIVIRPGLNIYFLTSINIMLQLLIYVKKL